MSQLFIGGGQGIQGFCGVEAGLQPIASAENWGLPPRPSDGIRLPVRFAPIIALLLALACVAPAKEPPQQQPKRRTVEDILDWDMDKTFDTRQSAPFRKSPGLFQSKSAAHKDFQYRQKFSPKDFSTKAYSGSKGWWAGEMKFDAKDANTKGKYEIPNAGTQYATREKPVKSARESDKTMATRTDRLAGREFRGKGRSQDIFDEKGPAARAERENAWRGNLHTLSMQDIKEILNTNK